MRAWRGSFLRRGRWGLPVVALLGLLVMGVVGGGASSGLQAQQAITWDLTWAPSLTESAADAEAAANFLADSIEAASAGRITVARHAPGSVVPGFSEFQGVADGAVDIAWGWMGAYTDDLGVSAFLLGTNTGIMGPWGGAYWATDPVETRPLIDALTEGTGVRVMNGPVPVAELFAVCRQGTVIESASDLQGLKFGASGYIAQILGELGATVQDIAQAEVRNALQSGAVDCAMAGPPVYNTAQGLQTVAPVWFGPAVHKQGRSGLDILVNQDAWDALPRDLQVTTEGAIKGFAFDYTWRAWDASVMLWQDIKDQVTVHQLPSDVQQWVRDTTIWFVDQQVQGDANATAIWENRKTFDAGWQRVYEEVMKMSYDTYRVTEGLSEMGMRPTDPDYIKMYRP